MKTRKLDWYETQLYNFISDNLIHRKKIDTNNLEIPEDFKEPCKGFKDEINNG